MKIYKLTFNDRQHFLNVTSHLRDENGNWCGIIGLPVELGNIEVGTTQPDEYGNCQAILSEKYHVDLITDDISLLQYIDTAITTASHFAHIFAGCKYEIAMPIELISSE